MAQSKMKKALSDDIPHQILSKSIAENLVQFKSIFKDCSDVVYRQFVSREKAQFLLIFIDGMIDSELIVSNLIKPLLYEGLPQGIDSVDVISHLCEGELFSLLQVKKLSMVNLVAKQILKGNLAIIVEGESEACIASVKKLETRSIDESTNEPTLRGPRESFTENMRTNITLIRRIFSTSRLKVETFEVGTLTSTEVVITYLEGVTEQNLLEQVRKRISEIKSDGILESGYIEESIEDTHFSPFPQMLNTERPDVAAASLLEGRIAILTDGSPFVLIVPMTFWSGLQAPDDYYERFLYVIMNRTLRFAFTIFGVLFSSLYVALTNFHQEMIPAKLMISIASLREQSPFPTIIEVFFMEIMFEGLREAGLRLPKTIGPLVSIVGALVIGEAAVRAGIISAPIVIVVSAAGVASFIIPRYRFGIPLRMLRFPILVLSGIFGLFGIAAGTMLILIHLVKLVPFGTPYLEPVAPLDKQRLKDWVIRWPRKLSRFTKQAKADGPS